MPYSTELLPNLFIPGAARSGTTTLHVHLNGHPEIFMSDRKEPHFLCRDDKGLGDYGRLFHGAQGYKYRGESSTGYMLLPEVIAKIQQFMPESRFIFMFRNPVDRAWSHYWHIKGGSGAEKADFREAFLRSMDEPHGFAMYNRHYHQTGLYARWLKNYLDAFGPDKVHVIVLEDLNADPPAVLQGLSAFLEVSDFDSFEIEHLNQSRIVSHPVVLRTYAAVRRFAAKTLLKPLPDRVYGQVVSGNRRFGSTLRGLLRDNEPPRIGAEDREWVAGFYRDEVERLSDLTGRSFAAWTDFSV